MSTDSRLQAYRGLIADVYELAGTSRATSEEIARAVGQTAARWHVMSVVSDQDLPVPAIARRLGLTRQSVQRVVDDLVVDGAVVLAPNPDHARSSLVRLATDGRRLLDEMFRRSEASRTALLERAGVDVDDLAEARRVIAALVAAYE